MPRHCRPAENDLLRSIGPSGLRIGLSGLRNGPSGHTGHINKHWHGHLHYLVEVFSFFFLVSSIAVKESASLVCSVTIIFMIKEVFQAHPWPCLLVDQEPLNLPRTCSCLHIAFLVAFWLVVPVIFFWNFFLYFWVWVFSFTNTHILFLFLLPAV